MSEREGHWTADEDSRLKGAVQRQGIDRINILAGGMTVDEDNELKDFF